MIPTIANHIWQSTIFALAAGVLTLSLRKQAARTRYWLWLAASIKFLVPFSVLVALGGRFEWKTAPVAPPPVRAVVEQISQPFAAIGIPALISPAAPASVLPILLAAVWFCGFAVVAARWWLRWRRIGVAARAGSPAPVAASIPVLTVPTLIEPGVFGLFRPALLLPQGIAERLDEDQLQAVLAHEICHVRRRDNLTAAIHMAVEATFWFHPVVWWIGSRLVDERERACDEEVLRMGGSPHAYAEAILNVCRHYLESPLACASGVTGADLKQRIETIMSNRVAQKLTPARMVLLGVAAIAAVAGPLAIGMLNAQSETLKFDVVSIKPASPDARGTSIRLLPGGGLNVSNTTIAEMIKLSYDVQDFQISGGPNWLRSERYDIMARTDPPEGPAEMQQATEQELRSMHGRIKLRLQPLLAERCGLALRRELKEAPVYELTIGRGGHKMKEVQSARPGRLSGNYGQFTGEGIRLDMFLRLLSNTVGRPIVDRTGLTGQYEFKLEWTPEPNLTGPPAPDAGAPPAAPTGPSIFTAIQEQLGLRLDSARGPVDMLVIDRIERPSEN